MYLPDELKRGLERIAEAEGRSEAQLIREGVRQVIERHGAALPRIPLFEGEDPTLAERVDELLPGFGTR